MRSTALLLALSACNSGDDAGGGGDTDADTDTQASIDYPADKGFEFDSGWYAVGEDLVACQSAANTYRFSGSAGRDGSGPDATVHVFFLNQPDPGSYDVVAYSPTVQPSPGKVGLGVIDERDDSFWYSDGASGTLDVVSVGGVSVDVVWHDVSLQSTTGSSAVSSEGWLRCTP